MSTRDKPIKARLGMLALAEEIQNISLACRWAGISRSHFYEIKEAFEKYGPDGLAPQARRRPRMPNQTPPEVERQTLQMTERYPTASYVRISQHLRLVGVGVTPSAVRYVWQRHGLTLRYQRLLCQDTYFVGAIKGVGRIYMQSAVDAHCSLGFAKLYLSKVPMTAVDVLNDRVLPFYEEHGVEPERVLTDHGTEFCGRFHRTLKEEFFAVASPKTFYESLAQLQAGLDQYLAFYNRERPHQMRPEEVMPEAA